MPSNLDGHVLLPPKLPPYLKSVYDLKPLVGIPKDDEVIAIHAVIRMAQKAIDIPGTGDPKLLAQLHEHLFDAQITKYKSRYMATVFPENTVYAPPILPAYVTIDLKPITGAPSEEEVIRVQTATRAYQHFANVPSMFDARVDMELSQHLFDIQMGKKNPAGSISQETLHLSSSRSVAQPSKLYEESNIAAINAGTGATAVEFDPPARTAEDFSLRDVIERSNQLIERSNTIAERTNQLVEGSNHLTESNKLAEKFHELLSKSNENSEKSNLLVEASTKYIERLGDILERINKVLVTIQHAIVRNHKGNTKYALDCLTNHNGETPGLSKTTKRWDLATLSENYASDSSTHIPTLIDGVAEDSHVPTALLADFLFFYGIEGNLCEKEPNPQLKPGKENPARERLRKYWASCLG
ncbi:hypothetical protein RSOLAG22IIIB_07492 [Rhizoctonia solani]|uniref:Laminin domain protein n=1 Tax=Rhizoctonia solani TaxID=456999 RepID=A0A0K6FNR4_9AGAM|nr:hypothetical protein RSOLAG22IIIB_07492 [Rhizoctonia solani]